MMKHNYISENNQDVNRKKEQYLERLNSIKFSKKGLREYRDVTLYDLDKFNNWMCELKKIGMISEDSYNDVYSAMAGVYNAILDKLN